MKALTALTLAAALVVSGTAFASADLAAKNKCNTCHAPDKKMMGPSWKDIAAKNKGAKAEDLAKKIVSGGKGTYGKIPMPPQAKAEGDSVAIAKWILSL